MNILLFFTAIFSGIINGLFASGAGQIVILTLVYILHFDTYKSRATSILMVSIVTILSLIRYIFFQKTNYIYCIIVITTSIIGGMIGAKLMKKIASPKLNLISGVMVFLLGIYSLLRKIWE